MQINSYIPRRVSKPRPKWLDAFWPTHSPKPASTPHRHPREVTQEAMKGLGPPNKSLTWGYAKSLRKKQYSECSPDRLFKLLKGSGAIPIGYGHAYPLAEKGLAQSHRLPSPEGARDVRRASGLGGSATMLGFLADGEPGLSSCPSNHLSLRSGPTMSQSKTRSHLQNLSGA